MPAAPVRRADDASAPRRRPFHALRRLAAPVRGAHDGLERQVDSVEGRASAIPTAGNVSAFTSYYARNVCILSRT